MLLAAVLVWLVVTCVTLLRNQPSTENWKNIVNSPRKHPSAVQFGVELINPSFEKANHSGGFLPLKHPSRSESESTRPSGNTSRPSEHTFQPGRIPTPGTNAPFRRGEGNIKNYFFLLIFVYVAKVYQHCLFN